MEKGNENTDGLKRPIQIKFRVTESERDMIYEKMRLLYPPFRIVRKHNKSII